MLTRRLTLLTPVNLCACMPNIRQLTLYAHSPFASKYIHPTYLRPSQVIHAPQLAVAPMPTGGLESLMPPMSLRGCSPDPGPLPPRPCILVWYSDRAAPGVMGFCVIPVLAGRKGELRAAAYESMEKRVVK